MTDLRIRVVVEGGEALEVVMSQQEWNNVQLDLNNADTDRVELGDLGFVRKDKLIAAYDVGKLQQRNAPKRDPFNQGQTNEQNPRDQQDDRSGSF
jgi:hypothetical protein